MTALPVSEAIEQRRAIKWFDPDHEMSEAEFRTLMQHAILSPTAFNIQNWRFVRVTDPELRQAIRQAAGDQAQVTDASLLLVLCFDSKAWAKEPQRYWRNAPPEISGYVVPLIDQYYRNREQVQRDEGMRSCGLVAMNLMLMAKQLGYDSCPMDGFDFDAVARLISLPADHAISMMLTIGKAIKTPWPRPGPLSLQEVLMENRF
jgi:nitroreductase